MSGLSLSYSTYGIENGSLATSFSPNNQTSYLNCTSIECFGKPNRYLSSTIKKNFLSDEKSFSIYLSHEDMQRCIYTTNNYSIWQE